MELFYFIMGIVFMELVYPYVSALFEVGLLQLESLKAQSSLKITKINSEIKKIAQEDEEPENSRVIGFVTENTEVEDDEEDEG